MKHFFSSISLFFLVSCAPEESLTITRTENNKDILLNHYYGSSDSIAILVPYSFKVKNNTFKTIYFRDFNVNDIKKNIKAFNEDGEDIEYTDKKFRKIFPKANETFYLYIEVIAAKKDLKSIPYERYIVGNKDIKDNPSLHKLEEFKALQKLNENDSVSMTFDHNMELMLIKVTKLNENKFKTITIEDLLNHPERMRESVFKP